VDGQGFQPIEEKTLNSTATTTGTEGNALVLPTEVDDETKTFFMYRAQLTFGLPAKASVHIPTLFRDWSHNSAK
jgi:hypothetical protein